MIARLGRTTILATAVLSATPVAAQDLESLGTRASALSAFVAVADDSTAVAWNPAGLASGQLFDMSLGFGRKTENKPRGAGDADVDWSNDIIFAAGLPPLGLSYYRLNSARLRADVSAGGGGGGRQDGHVPLHLLTTQHLGATVLQSLGDHLTVALTAKAVHGRLQTMGAGMDGPASVTARWTGDVDAGAMVTAGPWRAGLVVRNLTEPEVGRSEFQPVRLERHARVGVAWGSGWPGTTRTIVAVDADLTEVVHVSGDRRDIAAGAERWWRGHRFALRGGIRASTAGDARPVASVGTSVAVRSGLSVDAHVARGRSADRSWGVGARVWF